MPVENSRPKLAGPVSIPFERSRCQTMHWLLVKTGTPRARSSSEIVGADFKAVQLIRQASAAELILSCAHSAMAAGVSVDISEFVLIPR